MIRLATDSARNTCLRLATLAVVGTLLSTLAVGYGVYWTLPWVALQLPLIYCLLFGALISPTDPIAVMCILKSAGAPKELELMIAGESMFNDGVGVVIFTLLPGFALGAVSFVLLRSVNNYQV